MYVVWRKRPVKGKSGGPFLLEPNTPSGDREIWKEGLECRHRGGGRTAWTPLVVVAERIDGKPRQRVLFRFPTIRTCCIADPLNRAAWWHDVERSMSGWDEWAGNEAGKLSLERDLSRDRAAMMAKLREVVPRPTPKGLAAFGAYMAEKRVEQKTHNDYIDEQFRKGNFTWADASGKADDPNEASNEPTAEEAEDDREYEEWLRDMAEKRRRKADQKASQEETRRAWEERKRYWDEVEARMGRPGAEPDAKEGAKKKRTKSGASNSGSGRSYQAGPDPRGPFNPGGPFGGFGGFGLECFAILGVKPGATASEVKARYRELVKLHHPDAGGSAEGFIRIKNAYDQAMRLAPRVSA